MCKGMNANGVFEDWIVSDQWGRTELIDDSQPEENLEGHAEGFLGRISDRVLKEQREVEMGIGSLAGEGRLGVE